MLRVDNYPTHKYGNFELRAGKPIPFGASLINGGVNFSIYSLHATSCELVLFNKGEPHPFAIIPFPDNFRMGNVFSIIVFNLDFENIEYAFRMNGPYTPREGHLFNPIKLLMDPYAKSIGGRDIWAGKINVDDVYQHRARIAFYDFDWENDKPLEIPMENLIIYEMHVRGFTKHSSSGTKYSGTFSAIREKIPYLKELGVNCIELMPIFEFDEYENNRISPVTKERLLNYWGYSTVGFFAPKAGYAASGKYAMEIDELKALIKELHKNGIEIILDVVYNHTAEGNEDGTCISFKGIDNKIYYMITPEGYYYNFSGCGNTLNCNNPVVRNMILDSLRYWVSEYHIDGFRFDLASILGRNQEGTPMNNPPLIETLAFDPVLGKCKLIAEAWDAGGLYQVGAFPSWGRWAEWNGKFRDDMRRFIKGDEGMIYPIIQRLQGSPDLYKWNRLGACSSINFITCHDGFTLMDLVSYNQKHNYANGEGNLDGTNENYSWNCGCEGKTDDIKILELRKKQIKNAITLLMVSQGVPMILSGDEFGNSQFGNNNAYCQDNEISWLNWNLLKENSDIFNYFKKIIDFRKKHPILRRSTHFENTCHLGKGHPEISWHGVKAEEPDESYHCRTLAVMLASNDLREDEECKDEVIYIAMNMHWEEHYFETPKLNFDMVWYLFLDTAAAPPNDIFEVGKEKILKNQKKVLLKARSIVILVGRKKEEKYLKITKLSRDKNQKKSST